MTISPCAMLMTPITPNVMASPMAASSSTEPSESPYHTFCAVDHSASSCSIAATAAARRTRNRGWRIGRQAGEETYSVLVAAGTDDGHGVELVLLLGMIRQH